MKEKDFRARLVKEINATCDAVAVPIESSCTPGFPDIIAACHAVAFIECKVVQTFQSKKKLRDLFEATQLAFYRRWWKTQANNLWVAVYCKKSKETLARGLGPGLLDTMLVEVAENSSPYIGSIKRCAEKIVRCI